MGLVLCQLLLLPGALFACILFASTAVVIILQEFPFGIFLKGFIIRCLRSVSFEGTFLNDHFEVLTLLGFLFGISYYVFQQGSYDFHFIFSKDWLSEVLINIHKIKGKAFLVDLLEVGFEIRRKHHLEGMVFEHVNEGLCLFHQSQSDASLGKGHF